MFQDAVDALKVRIGELVDELQGEKDKFPSLVEEKDWTERMKELNLVIAGLKTELQGFDTTVIRIMVEIEVLKIQQEIEVRNNKGGLILKP